MGNNKTKALGVFALAMINVAAVLSLRNYPSMAVYGWSCIGWYVLGTIAFFIPLTLAGAELATGWPQGGGVYAWVREAFSERGFIASSVSGQTTWYGSRLCWPSSPLPSLTCSILILPPTTAFCSW
jgi:amino acid transporter